MRLPCARHPTSPPNGSEDWVGRAAAALPVVVHLALVDGQEPQDDKPSVRAGLYSDLVLLRRRALRLGHDSPGVPHLDLVVLEVPAEHQQGCLAAVHMVGTILALLDGAVGEPPRTRYRAHRIRDTLPHLLGGEERKLLPAAERLHVDAGRLPAQLGDAHREERRPAARGQRNDVEGELLPLVPHVVLHDARQARTVRHDQQRAELQAGGHSTRLLLLRVSRGARGGAGVIVGRRHVAGGLLRPSLARVLPRRAEREEVREVLGGRVPARALVLIVHRDEDRRDGHDGDQGSNAAPEDELHAICTTSQRKTLDLLTGRVDQPCGVHTICRGSFRLSGCLCFAAQLRVVGLIGREQR
mmetsp:Transcript_84147/g.223413  ORF Transcript_84147/g.223413 Transcript_84147/m.223413 type:complete len:356 (-) Transcript_84147:206-1273(-)